MNRTRGRKDGQRHRQEPGGQDERLDAAEREARDHADQTGYQPGVNQRRHEPMPASRHDDARQEEDGERHRERVRIDVRDLDCEEGAGDSGIRRRDAEGERLVDSRADP